MKTFRSVAVTMSGLVGISSMLLACSAEDASSTGTRSEAEQASGPGATASSVRDESSSEPAAAAAADEGASSAAGDPLAGTLAVPVVPTVAPAVFVNEVADKLCRSYAGCCFGDSTTVNGAAVNAGASGRGTYDQTACLDTYATRGFEGSALGITAAQTGVVVDATKRADCLAKLDALSCSPSGTELAAARASCFGAMVGQLAIGSTCRVTLQCAAGSFCKTGLAVGAGGGELGVCTALRTAGQPCGDVVVSSSIARDSVDSEVACSNRGGGGSGLACSSYSATTGSYKTDRSTWTCQPTVATNAICNTNVSCGSGLCDESRYTCKNSIPYFSVSGCGFFIKP